MGLFHGGSWEGSIYGPLSEPNGIMVSHIVASRTLPRGVLPVLYKSVTGTVPRHILFLNSTIEKNYKE